MKIIGIDLAWQSERNTTALAIGELHNGVLRISELYDSLAGLREIKDVIERQVDIGGVAIDASLIIENDSGQRPCEKALSKVYGGRKSSCHASNKTLYPNASSAALATYLSERGFAHLGRPNEERWQIECYPHPAIIEIFDLPERLSYKKGRVGEKKQGQVQLANLIITLEDSQVLKLQTSAEVSDYLVEENILAKRGRRMKQNEDALDSIICAYIGALYASEIPNSIFGSIATGYIYVPTKRCI
jgi:predicted RNase H-like nuclease